MSQMTLDEPLHSATLWVLLSSSFSFWSKLYWEVGRGTSEVAYMGWWLFLVLDDLFEFFKKLAYAFLKFYM